jgi:ribonuclease III
MFNLLTFHNEQLLRQALTHRSYVNEHPRECDNERLEFLGDALLNFLSGEYLYRRYPDLGEDEMTRRRAALVDEPQLARFAIAICLDRKMRLGQGAIRDGGAQNANLLSSTFEAVIGAYYLDHDRDITQLRPLVEQLFDSVPESVMARRSSIDAKNRLQEFAQANGVTIPPNYVTAKLAGPDHAPDFLAKVYINGKLYGQGQGKSKKAAEKQAAENALAQLIPNN